MDTIVEYWQVWQHNDNGPRLVDTFKWRDDAVKKALQTEDSYVKRHTETVQRKEI